MSHYEVMVNEIEDNNFYVDGRTENENKPLRKEGEVCLMNKGEVL